jgi:hypothetical protein
MRTLKYSSPERINIKSYMSPNRSLTKSFNRFDKSPLNRSLDRINTTNISSMSTKYNEHYNTRSFLTLEKDNFVDFMKLLLEEERIIERLKIDLSLKSDFNIEDVFRIFELDERGYLTELDVKYGLNALDIFPSNDEIQLFVKKYDIKSLGYIR